MAPERVLGVYIYNPWSNGAAQRYFTFCESVACLLGTGLCRGVLEVGIAVIVIPSTLCRWLSVTFFSCQRQK